MIKSLRSYKRTEGFTLIETLVAIVILSITFTSVWSWLSTSTKTSTQIETAIQLPGVAEQFLYFIETVPLDKRTEGSFDLGDFSVQWQSSLVKSSDQNVYRKQPQWVVAQYSVKFSIYRNQQEVFSAQTLQLRQWRDEQFIDFRSMLQ